SGAASVLVVGLGSGAGSVLGSGASEGPWAGTAMLSNAALTRSCSSRGSGTDAVVCAGAGSGEGDGIVGDAGVLAVGSGAGSDAVGAAVSVASADGAAPSASAVLALRDRPNAFRRRVRMPM